MTGTVLILGASGRFGHHAARAFSDAGWRVRRFRRGQDDLTAAAQGADLIVQAWNPPYPKWAAEVPGQTRAVIAAAKQAGATVLLPGNVYVFGPEAPERFGPDTPHAARNPLGRVRVEMEAAYRASGVQTIVLRAGDYLDTRPSGNWFDRVLIKRLGRGRLDYPGAPDAPHAWAYLPDMARAAMILAARRGDLARFEDVPFPGYTLTGRELATALGTAMGRPVALRAMSWGPLRVLAPVWPMARHLVEMRYLWSKPHRLDRARFDALLPGFVETPAVEALANAIRHQIDPDQTVSGGAGAVDQTV